MRQVALTAAKWVWLALVGGFAVAFVWANSEELGKLVRAASPGHIAVVAGLILASKIGLAASAALALQAVGHKPRFLWTFNAYNLSQLAKYVPGSIWQFVSRTVTYQRGGLGFREIRGALITETGWMLAGAAGFGLSFIGLAYILAGVPIPLSASLGGIPTSALVSGLLLTVAIAAVCWARIESIRSLHSWLPCFPTPRVALLQLAIWLSLGLSWWVLLPAGGIEGTNWLYMAGIFGVAYVVGFLVPIAPAGLGVREAVLVAGLAGAAAPASAAFVVLGHRLIYVLVEGILAVFALIRPERSARY